MVQLLPTTKLESIGIPFLAQLLEERFGLLYWRGGQPARKLPDTLQELAKDLRIKEEEVRIRLERLRQETQKATIEAKDFPACIEDDETILLDVRPKSLGEETYSFEKPSFKRAIRLESHFFLDLMPILKKAPRVIVLSEKGGRGMSGALYLRSLGVSAFALKGGAQNL